MTGNRARDRRGLPRYGTTAGRDRCADSRRTDMRLTSTVPAWASPAHWGIGTKVVALAVTSVAVTGIAMGGVSAWQSGRFADDAQTDVAALVEEDISRTATGVYDVVSTQGASTAAKVDSDLAAAHYVLGQAGGFSIDRNPKSPQVAWEAKNQLSGDVTPLSLPRVLIGDQWLGKNGDV